MIRSIALANKPGQIAELPTSHRRQHENMSELNPICEQLESFLAEELDDGQRRAFIQHLERCAVCSHQVEVAETLDPMIREAWQAIEMPDQVRQFVATDIGPPSKTPPVAFSSTASLAAAMVAIVVIGVSAIMIARSNRTPPTVSSIGDSNAQNVESPKLPRVSSDQAILLPTRRTDNSFTIVKAYPSVTLTADQSARGE